MHFVQGTGRVGSLFVEALVTETASEKDAQVWQSILRNLFSNLGEMSFTEPITALESKLFALDVFPALANAAEAAGELQFCISLLVCTPDTLSDCWLAGAHHHYFCHSKSRNRLRK